MPTKSANSPFKSYTQELFSDVGWLYTSIVEDALRLDSVSLESAARAQVKSLKKDIPPLEQTVNPMQVLKAMAESESSDGPMLEQKGVADFDLSELLESENLSDIQQELDVINRVRLPKDKTHLKVCFVTQLMHKAPEGLETNLATCFSEKATDLFEKMLKAMKLDRSEVLVTAIEYVSEEKTRKNLLGQTIQEIQAYGCSLVVTLGAQSTSAFLGRSERLARVHGQFFNKNISLPGGKLASMTIMPLFHPDLLLINPNMKKTAWTDMQKMMEKLG